MIFLTINCSVSTDWLLDRRHCNLKWQNTVKAIREKINAAIQDMPENEEIKQLLSGSCRSLAALDCPSCELLPRSNHRADPSYFNNF